MWLLRPPPSPMEFSIPSWGGCGYFWSHTLRLRIKPSGFEPLLGLSGSCARHFISQTVTLATKDCKSVLATCQGWTIYSLCSIHLIQPQEVTKLLGRFFLGKPKLVFKDWHGKSFAASASQRPHEQVPGMRRGDSEDDSEALSSSEKS